MRLFLQAFLLLGAIFLFATIAQAQTTANDDFYVTPEDQPVLMWVKDNDSSSNAPISSSPVTIYVDPNNGNLTNYPNHIVYTPNPGFNGIDSFVYSACDTAPDWTCDQATVTIQVGIGPNQQFANDDDITSLEDTPIIIRPVDNDIGPLVQVDRPSISITQNPFNGTVTKYGYDDLIYTPSLNFSGADTFEYQICSIPPDTICDRAIVTMNVYPVNDPPILVEDYVNTNDAPVNFSVIDNDYDIDGYLYLFDFYIVTPPTNGTATTNTDGTITYTPNVGFTGQDSLRYNICDDGEPYPTECGESNVYINVYAVCVPTVSISNTNEYCGQTDGTAIATVTGGMTPYLYSWSNGANTAAVSGLQSGLYQLTVTSENGCSSVTSLNIVGKDYIDLSQSSTMTSCNQADGTATATIIGGASSPTFLWSTGETTATISGLAVGWYSLTVENQASGCRKHQNIEVIEDPNCTAVISGQMLRDFYNKDCVQDVNSTPLAYRQLTFKSGATTVATVYTDAQGMYAAALPIGTYTLEYVPRAIEIPLCPATNTVTVDAMTPGQTYTQDFYLDNQVVADISVSMSHWPVRPGFNSLQIIHVCNDGPYAEDVTVAYKHDAGFSNFTPSSVPDSYNPNTNAAVWMVDNLAPFSCRTIHFSFDVPIPTPLGTLLNHNVTVTPVNGDLTPNNNNLFDHQIVTGSYDPNDKQNFAALDPFGGSIDPDILTYRYQIRFQNTGTDTAFTVVVRDEIEANLDINSIRPVSSSDDFTLSVEGNELVFFFENIMLPDSFVNEPASNGFVTFDINRLEGLPFGTEISNEANIYFDFNAPVLTNTVVNILEEGNELRAILVGPYNSSTGLMRDDLRSAGLLPLTEPYANLGYAVDNINATVSPSVFLTTGPDAIIDWVLVELRDPADKAVVIEAQCALLQADGDIVQVDGSTPIIFATLRGGSYHIAIKHRNHLAAISAATYIINQGNSLDFTDPATTENGKRILIAGDATGDGSVDASDRSDTWNNRNSNDYNAADVDMNGSTDASDRSACWNNRNKTTLVP